MAAEVVTLKVDGLKELRKALRDVDPALAKLLSKDLKKAAQIVADDAKRRVPVRSGRARDSIRADGEARQEDQMSTHGVALGGVGRQRGPENSHVGVVHRHRPDRLGKAAFHGHRVERDPVGYLAVAMDVPYAVAAEALAAASTRHQGPAVRAAQG